MFEVGYRKMAIYLNKNNNNNNNIGFFETSFRSI